MTYRIRDWNKIFENNRTRDLKKMEWVPVPNKMDGSGYTELVDHENGAAHLGAWYAILEISSRQKDRGTIPQESAAQRGDIPQDLAATCRCLSRISRLPDSVFLEVIPRLVQIGWIEEVKTVRDLRLTQIPHNPAPSCGAVPMEWNGMEWNGTTTTAQQAKKPEVAKELPPPSQTEYPLTRQAIRDKDPGVDDLFVVRLVQEVIQHCLSDPKFPPAQLDNVNDENISNAVRESYATGPPKHGSGLLLKRVKHIMSAWAQED